MVNKACKEIGVCAYELYKRAYTWAHGLLDIEKVREHYALFKKRGVIATYLRNFLAGSHHKVKMA